MTSHYSVSNFCRSFVIRLVKVCSLLCPHIPYLDWLLVVASPHPQLKYGLGTTPNIYMCENEGDQYSYSAHCGTSACTRFIKC